MINTQHSVRTALLIIDMQNDFVLPGAPVCVAGAIATIASIKQILAHFRTRQYPVFHVTREYRPDGSDVEKMRQDAFLDKHPCVVPNTPGCAIVAELTPLAGEYRIIKNRFSAFMCTELDLILRRIGIDHLVVTGTQLPNCVRATVFDAVCLDYEVTLITDGTSAQTPEIAAANILDMTNIGVRCMTADDFLSPD
jgi:nicotinamidase-related amidase